MLMRAVDKWDHSLLVVALSKESFQSVVCRGSPLVRDHMGVSS